LDALILAAGIGKRLLPLTRNTPVPLLDIGNGQTVLENQLAALAECHEIERVFLVGGYLVEQIEAKLADWTGLPVEIVFNPFFDRTSNLLSLWLGLLAIPSTEVIAISGDHLFQPEVVRTLLDVPPTQDACMAIDRPARQLKDHDMKVVVEDARVLEVSQTIALARAGGRAIGMDRWQGKGLRRLRHTLDTLVRQKTSFDWFYYAAVEDLIEQGFPVHCVECSENAWAEVDLHRDLEDVRQLVPTERFLQRR
jgi:choline kinase